MPAQTLFIVHQFEKVDDQIVVTRIMPFPTAAEAIERAEQATARYAGVVAIEQVYDTDTREVLEEPVVLVAHGDLPQEFRGE